MTTQCSWLVASWFARQLNNYNYFVGSIKYISTYLKGFEGDYLYAYVDLLGRDNKPRSYEREERGDIYTIK
jgi:hypothetical protein